MILAKISPLQPKYLSLSRA